MIYSKMTFDTLNFLTPPLTIILWSSCKYSQFYLQISNQEIQPIKYFCSHNSLLDFVARSYKIFFFFFFIYVHQQFIFMCKENLLNLFQVLKKFKIIFFKYDVLGFYSQNQNWTSHVFLYSSPLDTLHWSVFLYLKK